MAAPTSRSPERTRRRAVLVGVVVGLVVLVAFTVFVMALAEGAVRQEAERRVQDTAELSARIVEERSARNAGLIGAAAQSLSVIGTPDQAQLRPPDIPRVAEVLRRLRPAVPGATGALMLDRFGRVITGDAPRVPPVGTDLSGLEWYRRLAADPARVEPYLSRVYPSGDAATGSDPAARAIATATWIRGPGGQPLGVLAVTLGVRPQDAPAQLPEGGDASLTVTDQVGALVLSSGEEEFGPGLVSLRGRGPVAAALAGRSGVRTGDVDGRPTVSGFAPVPGTGWTVVADVAAADAFADVTRLRILLLAGAFVTAFGLVWLVPLLVLRLARAREQVALGERFQADLLPSEMPPGVLAHYLASERRMLLGGDFLDAVQTPDGGLGLLVGDVCGHGPRAAALAARLRAGWRTLATAGEPVGRLDLLDRLVDSERPDEDLYATVACAWVSPEGDRLRYALGGHPPLLLDQGGEVVTLEEGRGAALGLGPGGPWPVTEHALERGWTLALYTDGLTEAWTGAQGTRLEVEGLERLLADARRDGVVDPAAFLAAVQALGEGEGGGGHDDDVAVLVAGGDGGPPGPRIATGAARARQ